MSDDVAVAIGILTEAVKERIHLLDEAGSVALGRHDHTSAREALERATTLIEFRKRVDELRLDWAALATVEEPAPTISIGSAQPRSIPRLGRGLRTPEEAYRRPILEALVELGGSAAVEEVLRRVEERMGLVLNDFDRSMLASSKSPRWRNAAHWARLTMVDEGLLKSDTPHGMWEVTQAGRRALSAGLLQKRAA